MKFCETILNGIEAGHRWFSRNCLQAASALWRWQKRCPLEIRYCVGFVGLAAVSLWCAHQVSGAYVAACGFDGSVGGAEDPLTLLAEAGHVAGGARLGCVCRWAAFLSLVAAGLSLFRSFVSARSSQLVTALSDLFALAYFLLVAYVAQTCLGVRWFNVHWAIVESAAEKHEFVRFLCGHVDFCEVALTAAGGWFLFCCLGRSCAVRIFRLMQIAWAAFAVTAFLSMLWLMEVGPIAQGSKTFSGETRTDEWGPILLAALGVALWAGALLLSLILRSTRRAYGLCSEPLTGNAGERAVAGLKTTVGDRRWKSSLYYTLTLFFLVLFGKYLLFDWSSEEPYALPAGGGEQNFEQVQVKKIKKKKPKKLTVNPWSPYILERMNIDDVVTVQELEEETRDTYAAQNATRKGGKGKGTGGWPAGMADGKIRFIRLKYKGGDWDQDMGKGADYNLLLKFHDWTGMKIAKETEFREIERLKYFPKKKSPPFVFMTGMGGISLSEKEVRVLREYCLNEGGMLFIDNGGGHFDASVRAMLRRVFPGKPLVDIPNDDTIYQRPYVFPDGAPPFWHHAGYRAMGVRDEGRWVVFYHPGDINDAWKDDHSGASPTVADQAYKLGVNIMFYAFNQYYRRHYE